ncbi:MAG TPA: hypothetical protein VF533_23115 [Solirubrobacteraceae bacterium]|jgi:hypothetical protein
MSFFDEDVPTRRRTTPPRPRRGAPAGRSGGGGGGGSEQQQLLVRRGVAAGVLIVFLLLVLFAVNSCRSSAHENALKDYNREVADIGSRSAGQVGRTLFQQLAGEAAAGSPTDLQTAVASLRAEAEGQLRSAEDLSVPDEMVAAQRSLLIALEWRRDGLTVVAQRVPDALGDEGDAAEEAVAAIAGQMQVFLASDVIYATRVRPLIEAALRKEEIGGQRTPDSVFVPDISWLNPATVADRLGSGGGSGGGGTDTGEPAPGLHGTGLTSVAVGDTTLSTTGANRIAAAGPPTFNVQFANQGENDEQNVRVDVSATAGGRTIKGSDTVDTVARGATATASVRLPRTPPTDTAVEITVRVKAVPGEKKTDNNEQTYQALFTG